MTQELHCPCELPAAGGVDPVPVGQRDAYVLQRGRRLHHGRQALISRAVSRGLDASPDLKPSGLSWLGDIPQDWVATKPKYFTEKIVDGVHFKPTYVDDGIPFVTVRNLTSGLGISFENLNYITEKDHEEFYKRANPQHGDVLLTKDGATLGVAIT